jgi:hypothetical protein
VDVIIQVDKGVASSTGRLSAVGRFDYFVLKQSASLYFELKNNKINYSNTSFV